MESPPVPISLMAGPVASLIGCFLNWFFFGALIVQVYDYHSTFYVGDRKQIRCLVYSVFIIELVSTGLITNTAWEFVVLRWGSEVAFTACPTTSPISVGFNCIIAFIVQAFFAWRIYSLRRDWLGKVAAGAVIVVSLLAGVFGAVFTYNYRALKQEAAKLIRLQPITATWLIASFVCDFMIAVSMVAILILARKSTSFSRTKNMVNQLIVHTLETGAATAVIAAMQCIFFMKMPENFLHVSQLYVLGRMYSNVLLASLNGRHRMRNMVNDLTFDSRCLASFQTPPPAVGSKESTCAFEMDASSKGTKNSMASKDTH